MNTNLGLNPGFTLASHEDDECTIEMLLIVQKPWDDPKRKSYLTNNRDYMSFDNENVVYYQLNFVDEHQIEDREKSGAKWLNQLTPKSPIWYAGKTSDITGRGVDERTVNKDCLIFVKPTLTSKKGFNEEEQGHLEFLMIEDLFLRMGRDEIINVDNQKREKPKFERGSSDDRTMRKILDFILETLQHWGLPGFAKISTLRP